MAFWMASCALIVKLLNVIVLIFLSGSFLSRPMPIRFQSFPLAPLALALNLSGRYLSDSALLASVFALRCHPFRHLPLKRPGTPFIKIFANPVKSLLVVFPYPQILQFCLEILQFCLGIQFVERKGLRLPRLKGTFKRRSDLLFF